MNTRLIIVVLIVLGLLVSLASAGGYADPKIYDEWRPASVGEADALNVVGHFNRAIVHLTGLYERATFYAPLTNRASPVYVEEEWMYGGYPYFTDAELGPVSNRCG